MTLLMTEDSHRELLAQVASMYYERDMTQNVIADELGMSRAKVYRLLKEARELRVVQIIIDFPIKRDAALEDSFKQAFGLKDVLILKTSAREGGDLLARLGQLGARCLESLLEDSATMALCLGRSTYEVINAIRPDFQAKVRIAQAMGGMPPTMQDTDSGALARLLARKIDAEVLYLLSPLLADSAEAAAVMRSQREIQRTLDTARIADVALLGIGNLDPSASKFVKAGFITPGELAQLSAEGAVGDLAGQFFNQRGELHPCSFNQRVIAIGLEELRGISTVMAVASGVDKARAVLGALRTGVIDVLCTDSEAAEAVLQMAHEQMTQRVG
jgi:DNA-binding transcriptional regulator LsrR (DeoR family)